MQNGHHIGRAAAILVHLDANKSQMRYTELACLVELSKAELSQYVDLLKEVFEAGGVFTGITTTGFAAFFDSEAVRSKYVCTPSSWG